MEYAIWIFIMVLFIIIEACTSDFICIWFAVGAFASVISLFFKADVIVQIAVFVAVSALALYFTKPFVKKLRNTQKTPTNADRLIGKTGIVTEEITNDKFAGKVKLAGQEWSAVSVNGEEIPKNSKVCVKAISGVKLEVEWVRFPSVINN